eukprot:CAMPEP_0197915632 /NCGR_PEP_ID=MMETSP1439-20131203/80544_1 /TAXON_ID=66791 /ORGANISM="Gonyaulax spinifera, Strain CCMP409" /LENGTH=269 /DNA_ID=CAMNT_0043537599 /DNA_START=172 /DNA_END=981 /DNA_ORIENTATION=+
MAENIMPMMTKEYNQIQGTFGHVEYRRAMTISPNCTITILRDPVERFASEFNHARSNDKAACFQDQWDWHEVDFDFLNKTERMTSREEALLRYLRYKWNPTRNRQALYLLGFARVRCRKGCCKKYGCTESEPFGYPALAYDWSQRADELLARAKRHLTKLRAFMITDCYSQSIAPLAKAMGWDEQKAVKMAKDIHARQVRNRTTLEALGRAFGADPLALAKAEYATPTWSSMLPSPLLQEIREVNAVDVQLVAFAKQLLWQRHGISCKL